MLEQDSGTSSGPLSAPAPPPLGHSPPSTIPQAAFRHLHHTRDYHTCEAGNGSQVASAGRWSRNVLFLFPVFTLRLPLCQLLSVFDRSNFSTHLMISAS
uniref:Uncharacterized protein n=1 Tax=Echinococcus granulosus TaxID=6210 RepID=A0A068WLH6_ECHGR|nr:hypothetical protein EgrG_000457400 [Echinococcus granulosus]